MIGRALLRVVQSAAVCLACILLYLSALCIEAAWEDTLEPAAIQSLRNPAR